jgi:limonene-1,2-epoxide hydrolase
MAVPLEVVSSFCAAWSKLDIDELMTYFADDAVYHNIPVDPVVGRDAIRSTIEGFTAGVERVNFEVRHAVAQDNIVLTERVDHFHTADRVISLPVMGAFEVTGGRIASWRDYFDLNQFMSQLGS